MFWTLDRVNNISKSRLDMLIRVLSKFENNYDRVAIYQELINLNYVKEPNIPDGKRKKEVYEKKWGSYVGPLTAFGIAKIQENKVIFSELAKEYRDGKISFEDYIKTVMIRWQLPNGGLTSSKADEYLTEGVLLKPFILVLQVLLELHKLNRFECWIDGYDIINHLLKSKNNEQETIDALVAGIIEDRLDTQVDRKIGEFKLDVVFNTFCSTGFLGKNKLPDYMPFKTSYTLLFDDIKEIEQLIDENIEVEFKDPSDIKNKDKWLAYYGGSINNSKHNGGAIKTGINKVYNAQNLILFGSPGTGKSYELQRRFGENAMRVTFHPEYTYQDFVGSYRPVPIYRTVADDVEMKDYNGNPFTLGEPRINYQFVPGPFTMALERALKEPNKLHTLIIEEINRANVSAVFGDLFQLLDRDELGKSLYSVINPELANYLSLQVSINLENEIVIPPNLNLVATMNSADQGVFVLDSAFKRRWNFEYLPIEFTNVSHAEELVFYENKFVKWKDFVYTLNDLLSSSRVNEDKLIGPYFMKKGEPTQKDLIASKLLVYLWDDVVRTRRNLVFRANIQTFAQLVREYHQGAAIFNCEFSFSNSSMEGVNPIGSEVEVLHEES